MHASHDMLAGWTVSKACVKACVDHDSIFRFEGTGSAAEQSAGKKPQAKFGRVMKLFGIELVTAPSCVGPKKLFSPSNKIFGQKAVRQIVNESASPDCVRSKRIFDCPAGARNHG
jgi:hypothetical protein